MHSPPPANSIDCFYCFFNHRQAARAEPVTKRLADMHSCNTAKGRPPGCHQVSWRMTSSTVSLNTVNIISVTTIAKPKRKPISCARWLSGFRRITSAK